MQLIKASDIVNWAATMNVRETLPKVVRLAIHASNVKLTEKSFPAGVMVGKPGLDGYLVAEGGTEYVQKGISCWEFGASDKFKTKANSDYSKRTKAKLGFDKKKATFIFVTPRRWDDKDEWAKKKTAEKKWKKVRVYDAADLDEWLETEESVSIFLAETLDIVKPGTRIRSVERQWAMWSNQSKPAGSEELAMTGREEITKALLEKLAGKPDLVAIQADSEAEALGFVAAVLHTVPSDSERASYLARSVVCGSLDDAVNIAARKERIIISPPQDLSSANLYVSQGNHVVLCVGNDYHTSIPVLPLPRPPREKIIKALENMGLEYEKADRLAVQAGRSLTILQRRMKSKAYEAPGWSSSSQARELIPALLAGAWDEYLKGDKKALEDVSGLSYDDFSALMHGYTLKADPPLRRVGTVWKLSAPMDIHDLLIHRIVSADITKFLKVADRVLREVDPALDLPPDDRPFAPIQGKIKEHSEYLTRGIAESLLYISLGTRTNKVPAFGNPEGIVNDFVAKLFNKADWKLWASLSGLLSVLAEAAPLPFMRAVGKALEGDAEAIRPLFVDGGMLGRNHHTGLLWGLEILAWNPAWLLEACRLLARLHIIDPGGNLSNRPLNTLRDIFLSWHPQTFATIDARLGVYRTLAAEFPDVGWDLTRKLMPNAHSITSGNIRPICKDFGEAKAEVLLNTHQFKADRTFIGIYFDFVRASAVRLGDVVDHVGDWPPDLRREARDLYSDEAISRLTVEDRAAVWETVKRFVDKNRKFSDAVWSLKESELLQWDEILVRLAPTDLIGGVKWLFDDQYPDVPIPADDFDAQEKYLTEARNKALRDIFAAEGLDGIKSLIAKVHQAGVVAWFLSGSLPEEAITALIQWLLGGDDHLRSIAAIASGQIAHSKGLVSAKDWLKKFSFDDSKDIALLISRWPDERAVWDFADSLGADVQKQFWREKMDTPIRGPVEDLIHVVKKYVEYGRPFKALTSMNNRMREVPSTVLFSVLERIGLLTEEEVAPFVRGLAPHYIQSIFKIVKERRDVEIDVIASFELPYLALLVGGGRSERQLAIHEMIASSPEFYVSLISTVYKPSKPSDEDKKVKREDAESAQTVLRSWRILPGQKDDEIDATILLAWMDEVRQLGKAADREYPCDSQVGRAFAHAPVGKDGAWPHEAVRKVIERFGNEALFTGMRVEIFNKRGAHFRAVDGGGADERVLARHYRDSIDKMNGKWPRTAEILTIVEQMWIKHGDEEDRRNLEDDMFR